LTASPDMDASHVVSPPSPGTRYRRRVSLVEATRDLWRARGLIRTLTARDLRSRYKQAILGFGWAVIPPLALLFVLSFFVKRIGGVDTQGVPYELYTYIGLVPWTFFAAAVLTGGTSLLSDMSILNRVYCPREVFPLASVTTAGVDALTSLIVLIPLFILDDFTPKVETLFVPLILAEQLAFTIGLVLVVAGVVVYLRDVRHALPLVLQLGLFATPVAYSLRAIPGRWRLIYCLANPIGEDIDAYRRTVLLGKNPDWSLFLPAAVVALGLLLGGYNLFKRLETGIADVA